MTQATFKSRLTLCLIAFFLVAIPKGEASAELPRTGTESNETLDQQGARTKDASKYLEEVIEKLRVLDDYLYDSEVYAYLGGRPKVETGKFYFKKENRVRVESTSGKTSGSIVVRRKDGLVRAKAGAMLLGITMTLHENSALLNAVDGTNVIRSDLLTQMLQLRDNIRAGGKGLVTSQSLSKDNSNVYVMDVYLAGQEVPGDRIIVNASTGLPLELIHYNKGAVFSRTLVKNLRVNSGVAESLFEI